jgi:nucleoside-diphosphate-sugar epimerase
MRVLVVGGTGFVGLHAVLDFTAQGYDIVALNRGRHIERLPNGVKTLVADRHDAAAVKAALSRESFDACLDTCGYRDDDVRIVLDALGGRCGRYVFCSTVSVYDESALHVVPVRENAPLIETCERDEFPYNYGYKKVLCERAAFNGPTPAVVVRPSFIYGPDNPLYREAYWFDRVLRDRPIFVPGGGLALSQMGHVDDLARAFRICLDSPKVAGNAYNVSSPVGHTAQGIAVAVARATDRTVELIHVNRHEYEALEAEGARYPYFVDAHDLADVSAFMRDTGWVSEYDLDSGYSHSLDWYSRHWKREPDFRFDDAVSKCRVVSRIRVSDDGQAESV